VDACDDVALGARPVPAIASTFSLRDGDQGALGAGIPPGEYGLYGVAQDDDCAVVAAGCVSVFVSGDDDVLSVTLANVSSGGCATDEVCSPQTGDCLDMGAGTGGSSGNAGAGGEGGIAGSSGGTGGGGSNRIEESLILLYAFDEGAGSVVFDRSNVSPALDLTIADLGNVTWGDRYLSIDAATSLSSSGAATKVYDRATATGELTVEAWIKPATVVPVGTPPDRIISMSEGTSNRNFLLGQDGTHFAARFRADGEASNNGNPQVVTTDGTATTSLTHVVFAHRADGAEVLYVDGVENTTFSRLGGLSTWDASYAIVVANETSQNREWLGELHLIAVYERALDAAEVSQNFLAGP